MPVVRPACLAESGVKRRLPGFWFRPANIGAVGEKEVGSFPVAEEGRMAELAIKIEAGDAEPRVHYSAQRCDVVVVDEPGEDVLNALAAFFACEQVEDEVRAAARDKLGNFGRRHRLASSIGPA